MSATLEKARKQATRLLLTASIIYATLGLIAPQAGYTPHHMTIMLLGAIILFPHSVALAYIASATPRNKATILLIATLASLPLLITPLLELALPGERTLLLIIPPSILTMIAAWIAAAERKGSTRLSLQMVAATYASLTLAVIQLTLQPQDPITRALTLTLAYPIPLIIAVTTHSLPATFRDHPHNTAILTLLLAILAAQTLPHSQQTSAILQIAALATYPFTTKIYKTYNKYIDFVKQKTGAAKQALQYYLTGHQLIPILLTYTIITIITRQQPLTILHAYTIGIIIHHIIIHAPLMLPVILGIKHKRNYTNIPYITLLLSTITWPINKIISLILLIITILLVITIVRR